VQPDSGHVPGQPVWSGPRPGVKVEDGKAKIPVEVKRIPQVIHEAVSISLGRMAKRFM
jgi:hypothetical protein